MDKVTCIAFILYQNSNSQDVKESAIQLLNGDVSLRDINKMVSIQPLLVLAESLLKKNKINKNLVQEFAEKFLLIEA